MARPRPVTLDPARCPRDGYREHFRRRENRHAASSLQGCFAPGPRYMPWTFYQQFLLQDFFMQCMLRLVSSEAAAITLAGALFAAPHLPNVVLTGATLAEGIVSCALFRRYRNLWALGLAQGLLGLCFAVSVPDALHHHLRVGLGYLRYRATQAAP